MRKLLWTLLIAAPIFGLALPASAQSIERLGDFQSWSAFKTAENGQPVCFMASRPVKDEGNYQRRGDIYTMVTHRPGEGRRDEVSIIAGYTYQPGSRVTIQIDGTSYTLHTRGEGAWPADRAADAGLVQAMVKGIDMVVKGTSSRGTLTTDTYSLRGFTAAREAINKACGL